MGFDKNIVTFLCHYVKGSGKEGQGPRKRVQDGAASAEQQQQQPDIEAWAVIENSFDKDAWTVVEEAVKEAADSNVRAEKEQTDSEAWAVIEEALDEEEKNQTNFACKPCTESELYDSGASCHMSPSVKKKVGQSHGIVTSKS